VSWQKDPWGNWEPTPDHGRVLAASHASTVEVLGDDKVRALGVAVGKGWVLTKRSELIGPSGPYRLSCRLANGERINGTIAAASRDHDLALLKVPGATIPALRWGKSAGLRAGHLVASVGPGTQPMCYGIVGAVRVANPDARGYLPIKVAPPADGSKALVFQGLVPAHLQVDNTRDLLKPGDRITGIDGNPPAPAEEFARRRDDRAMGHGGPAGEWVKLTVRRGDTTFQVFLPLVDGPTLFPGVWRDARWNLRRSGFPSVFCHDGGVAHDLCGGPVVDRSGTVIGLNIARVNQVQTIAIPSDTVGAVLQDLLHQARVRDNEGR
jgi:S1-C subfamily serine protease